MTDRIGWDKYFLNICEVVSTRSIDEDTKVGCVIVDKRNRIVATGYNSFPAGVDDTRWPKNRLEKLHVAKLKDSGEVGIIENLPAVETCYDLGEVTKYDVIAHAEENAIASRECSLQDCTLYCTYLPCHVCTRLIITAGIRKVIYKVKNPRFERSYAIALDLFREAGVKVIEFK